MMCEEIKTFEDVVWENRVDLIRRTLDYTSDFCDGVAQIDVDTGELHYAGFTTGEVENPENRVVEVYRINQGFDKESCAECLFCEDSDDEGCYCTEEQLEDCVMDSLLESFIDDFDDIMSAIYSEIQEWGYDMV